MAGGVWGRALESRKLGHFLGHTSLLLTFVMFHHVFLIFLIIFHHFPPRLFIFVLFIVLNFPLQVCIVFDDFSSNNRENGLSLKNPKPKASPEMV